MKIITILNLVISMLRNFVSAEVVAAIKQALIDFAAHGEWTRGERTEFAFAKVRELAAASENRLDDSIVEILILAYELRFQAEGKIATKSLPEAHPI